MDLDTLRITKEDMTALLLPEYKLKTDTLTGYFANSVIPKFKQFRILVPANHKIDPTLYDIVIAIGDIHADFRKFLQILEELDLITLPSGLDPYTNAIYNLDIICNTKWNKVRTLVILVGDLVDGSRGGPGGVDDPKGAFEFLLHCFLYNIRLSAKQQDSDVVFTMGNHDLRSVFSTIQPHNDIFSLYNYVHPTTWEFLDVQNTIQYTKDQQRLKRRAVLEEFYKNSPYGMILLENETMKEAALVHGGFHMVSKSYKLSPDPIDSMGEILPLQQKLNNDLDIVAFTRDLYKNMDNVTETRYYSESTDPELCSKLTNFPYKKIVVGHCQTMSYKPGSTFDRVYNDLLMNNPDRHTKCTRGNGCVLLVCKNPQIAFTDVGISQAFFRGKDNSKRAVEVLVLVKNNSYRNGSQDEYYITSVKQATENKAVHPITPLLNTTPPPPFSSNYMEALNRNLNSNVSGFPETMRVKQNEANINRELKRERILMATQKRMNLATVAAASGSSRRRRRQRKQQRGSRKTRKRRI